MPQSFYVPEGTNGTTFIQNDQNLERADTIDGLAQKNVRMRQIIALVSLSSFFIALGVLIYAVTLPKTVPVVVTVNPEGEAGYVGKIDKSSYGKTAVPDIAKEYQVKRLLTKMHRGWPTRKPSRCTSPKTSDSCSCRIVCLNLGYFFKMRHGHSRVAFSMRQCGVCTRPSNHAILSYASGNCCFAGRT
jgi:hypothetical protein